MLDPEHCKQLLSGSNNLSKTMEELKQLGDQEENWTLFSLCTSIRRVEDIPPIPEALLNFKEALNESWRTFKETFD